MSFKRNVEGLHPPEIASNRDIVTEFLRKRNPFYPGDESLYTIANSVVADETAYVDRAEDVGARILTKLQRTSVASTIPRVAKCTTLADQSSMRVDG